MVISTPEPKNKYKPSITLAPTSTPSLASASKIQLTPNSLLADSSLSSRECSGYESHTSKYKKGIMFDINHLKFKATNVIRDYYTSTTEGFASIVKNFNDSGSELLWLLGTVYVQIEHSPSAKQLSEADSSSSSNISNTEFNTNSNRDSENELPKKKTADVYKNTDNNCERNKNVDFTNFERLDTSTNLDHKHKWGIGFDNLFPKKKSQYPVNFIDRFQNLIWCTYRYNCRALDPSNFTTDAGWGCMLRAGQSLVAQALQYHYFGKDYSIDWNNNAERIQYLKIIDLFMDDQEDSSVFSIYNMSEHGKKQGKTVGEWFGPNGTCNIIKSLGNHPSIPIDFYTTSDGVIKVFDFVHVKNEKASCDIMNETFVQNFYMYPTLVIVVTRLGIDKVNPIYNDFIKFCISMPQSVGIAGGKPSSALYFVGFESNDLVYLDPHFNRPAMERKNIEEYTKEDISTYRCSHPKKINISRIDPCMFIGFYIHDIHEFVDFYRRIISLGDKKIPSAVSFVLEKSERVEINTLNTSSSVGVSVDSISKNKDMTDEDFDTGAGSEDEALDEWVI